VNESGTPGARPAVFATTLGMVVSAGGALLVLVAYLPALQAPFLVPKFAVLETAASMGLVAFALHRASNAGVRWPRGLTAGAWLVLATTAIAWAAAIHGPLGAPYAVAAMARWGALFGMACASSLVDEPSHARWRVFEAITVAAAAVAAIGILQHLEVLPLGIPVISKPGSTFGNRNPAAEAIAMALPFGLAAAAWSPRDKSRAAMGVSVVVELLYLGATRARGAWIGAACGLAVALWIAKARLSRASLAMGAMAIVAAAIVASVPGRLNPRDVGDTKRYARVVEVLQEGLDTRATALRTRLGLWRRTVAMIREHPLLGVGPGNWPVAFPLYAEPGAASDGVLTAARGPRQAHDDLLERTAETGLPGLLALGVLGASVLVAVRRRLATGGDNARAVIAAASGSLVALITISLASFPLEMPATIALAGIALGFIAGGSRSRDREKQGGKEGKEEDQGSLKNSVSFPPSLPVKSLPLVVGALLLVVCAVVRAETSIRCSHWLGVAERALHRDRGVEGAATALAALDLAFAAQPEDYRASLRASQMLLREQRSLEAASAARRALAIEPYAPNAWTALAAADLAAGDPATARRDADEALRLLVDDPFALDVRARAATQTGDEAAAAVDRSHLRDLAARPEDSDTTRAARALLTHAE
jgi:O-antigen ligase